MANSSIKFLASLVLVVLLIALALMVSPATRPVAAQASPLLWLDPVYGSAAVGATTSVVLRLSDVTNVYGTEAGISFDPAILAVVDANTSKEGVQIEPGSCPAPDLVMQNSADNTAGTIAYGVTQLGSALPCNGGPVAGITFQCLVALATSPITIESSIISDPDGVPIVHSTQNGTVECTAGGFEVVGNVGLQGWTDPSGAAVTLYDSSDAIADGPVVVGSDGAFLLNAADELETYGVKAAHDRYLGALASGVTGTAGSQYETGLATLPAGDLNGDGLINILDITMVAGNFGKETSVNWGE